MDIEVTGGAVRGSDDGGIARFLGIPYAAAPVRPEPHATAPARRALGRRSGRRPTTVRHRPRATTRRSTRRCCPSATIPGDECLNLNVWTPADAVAGGRLPVLVWIHGGSFMNGSGRSTEYDGSAFARDGVVCVTINYRLGRRGLPLRRRRRGRRTANLGLQDQVAALRWVQDNIAAFGGDPARVTVAGESAGAMSVTTLLAMPSARGLFAQAITQSGAAAHTLTPETGPAGEPRTSPSALGVEPTREAITAVDLDTTRKAASDLVSEVQTAAGPAAWGAARPEPAAVRAGRRRRGARRAPARRVRRRRGVGRGRPGRLEPRRGPAVPRGPGHHRPRRRADARGAAGGLRPAARGSRAYRSNHARTPHRATCWPPWSPTGSSRCRRSGTPRPARPAGATPGVPVRAPGPGRQPRLRRGARRRDPVRLRHRRRRTDAPSHRRLRRPGPSPRPRTGLGRVRDERRSRLGPVHRGPRTTGLIAEKVEVVDDPRGDELAVWSGIR